MKISKIFEVIFVVKRKKVRARVGVVDRDVKNLESKTTEIHTDQREQIFGVLLSIHAPIVELLSFLF
jgi:hypothetical protein